MNTFLTATICVSVLLMAFVIWFLTRMVLYISKQGAEYKRLAEHYKRSLEYQAECSSRTQSDLGEAITQWKAAEQKGREVGRE